MYINTMSAGGCFRLHVDVIESDDIESDEDISNFVIIPCVTDDEEPEIDKDFIINNEDIQQ